MTAIFDSRKDAKAFSDMASFVCNHAVQCLTCNSRWRSIMYSVLGPYNLMVIISSIQFSCLTETLSTDRQWQMHQPHQKQHNTTDERQVIKQPDESLADSISGFVK